MRSTSEDLMTVAEVAVEVRCPKPHVNRIIRGEIEHVSALPALSLGRRALVRRGSLDHWKAANERCARSDMLAASPEVYAS